MVIPIWWEEDYEPEYVVGDLLINNKHNAFYFDTSTKQLELNKYCLPHPGQNTLSSSDEEKIKTKITQSSHLAIQQINLGVFYCHSCEQLINLFTAKWSDSICLNCSMDYAQKIKDTKP